MSDADRGGSTASIHALGNAGTASRARGKIDESATSPSARSVGPCSNK
jgi:hypothetical protein